MARPTILRMAAVNLRVHPHPAGVYERLLRLAHRRRLTAKVHADRHGIISQIWASPDPQIPGIHGTISTYLQFDAKEPWIDLETFEEATDEELNKIELPEHLRPSLRRCRFVLDSKIHILSFDIEPSKGGMSPNSMLRFLEGLFAHAVIVKDFGPVGLTIVHEDYTVDRLFSLERISEIFIQANRPNPGDYDTTPYEDLEDFLREQQAERLEQRISSSERQIVPNEATIALARVADENGFVRVRGANENGEVIELSTKDSAALVETESYNADVTDDTSATYSAAARISESIRRRRGRVAR